MGKREHFHHAVDLHALIIGSSDSPAWADVSNGSETPPAWQQEVVAKILTLTFGQEIRYLSTAMPDDQDWDIVAFTDFTVAHVIAVREGTTVPHTEAVTFPRSSLDSLELVGVAPIPGNGEDWPSELSLIGHYRLATLKLPLDKFASQGNKRSLASLLASLLHDLSG